MRQMRGDQNGDANFQNSCDDINPIYTQCEDKTSRLKIGKKNQQTTPYTSRTRLLWFNTISLIYLGIAQIAFDPTPPPPCQAGTMGRFDHLHLKMFLPQTIRAHVFTHPHASPSLPPNRQCSNGRGDFYEGASLLLSNRHLCFLESLYAFFTKTQTKYVFHVTRQI